MNIYRRKLVWKAFLLIFAVLIGLGSLFYTRDLVSRLKTEEKKKAELWAEAFRRLVRLSDSSDNLDFIFSIIEDNKTVPVILIDYKDNIIAQRNLPSSMEHDTLSLVRELKRMEKRNEPISVDLGNGIYQYLYYRESTLLRQLKIYPFVQMGIILLFIVVAYVAFNASRVAEQNQVWVGLSRETAHQLGTPASSLSAWVELFKTRYPGTEMGDYLAADVDRLGRVAERFSLIGSKPKLYPVNLAGLAEETIGYLRKRIASTIDLQVITEEIKHLEVPVNPILLGWVIENIVKNSVDAMKGNGTVFIRITETEKEAFIDIEDTGKGIHKKNFRNIFKPGFSTREHGWGLGLSLSKRIIEDYHKGKIFIRYSEPGKGTSMRVALKKH